MIDGLEQVFPEKELKESVLEFVRKYGLLGFMTALPTTADFITYKSVYLPKNHFIKEESLPTEKYLSYFYPFDELDFRKKGVESGWSVTDREGIAITMAMGNAPQAVASGHFCFRRHIPDLPDSAWERFACYRMGFPFTDCHGADVLFLHATPHDSALRNLKSR